MILGGQFGFTAAIMTYSYMQPEFAFWPLCMKKSPGYTKIGMAFVGAFMMGHGFVMAKFGDK